MDQDPLCQAARAEGLLPLGPVSGPGLPLPEGCARLLLLCPDPQGFWPRFHLSPEAADGRPDPIDRWSRRVIGALAARAGGRAFLPFDGPPWQPFLAWLQAAGAHPSPLGMLVHPRLGLWISCRGAIGLPAAGPVPDRDDTAPPAPPDSPCARCTDRPCLGACPVGAFGPGGYDLGACIAHLDGPAGHACLSRGCAARHACPAGSGAAPAPDRAAFHMAAFLRTHRPDPDSGA